MNKAQIVMQLSYIAAVAEKASHDVQNNKIWTQDLFTVIANIRSSLDDVIDYANEHIHGDR